MNDEIMNTQTRFWNQLSAPDLPKWATRAQKAPQRASMHFLKNHEKKLVKTYVFFSKSELGPTETHAGAPRHVRWPQKTDTSEFAKMKSRKKRREK